MCKKGNLDKSCSVFDWHCAVTYFNMHFPTYLGCTESNSDFMLSRNYSFNMALLIFLISFFTSNVLIESVKL